MVATVKRISGFCGHHDRILWNHGPMRLRCIRCRHYSSGVPSVLALMDASWMVEPDECVTYEVRR